MTADKNPQKRAAINLRRHHDLYERRGEFYSREETDHQTLTLSKCKGKDEEEKVEKSKKNKKKRRKRKGKDYE